MDNNENKNALENNAQSTNVDYVGEIERLKQSISKLSSENADWKRKYNSTLSDQEQQKVQLEEREKYYQEIERENKSIKLKAEFKNSISDDKIIENIVVKMIDGNLLEAVKELNKFISAEKENVKKSIQDELLRSNPTPPPQQGNAGVITKEQFAKMDYNERAELFTKDPELYNKLNS